MILNKYDKIIFIGDSITDCGRKYDGDLAPVSNPLGNGFVQLVFAYLHATYPELHINVINKGIGGNRSIDVLNRFQSDAIELYPDWLFLMIGVNDVWRYYDCPERIELHLNVDDYRNNLENMITKAIKNGIKIVIISPFMIEANKKDIMRHDIDQRIAICEELCKKFELPYINVQAAFDNVLKKINNHELSRDRVHPNWTGHMIIMKSIIEFIENKN